MTTLCYLTDTYLFELDAQVFSVNCTESSSVVVLDQTIFYPQGGGQPADHGTITSATACFTVDDVRFNEDGSVLHYGAFKSNPFAEGDIVHLAINKEVRMLHARLHAAGHLIDCAVEKLGLTGLTAGKGFHFPQGPYVEYEGELESCGGYKEKIEKIVNDLVCRDLKLSITQLTCEEAQQQGIWVPEGKVARVANFEGFSGCGCGGTLVHSSSEIGSITIRKMKTKKGIVRISYSLES